MIPVGTHDTKIRHSNMSFRLLLVLLWVDDSEDRLNYCKQDSLLLSLTSVVTRLGSG